VQLTSDIFVVAVSSLTHVGMLGIELGRRIVRGEISSFRPVEVPLPSRPEDVRQRKLMSHAAWMSALVMRDALTIARWSERREEIGAYFGVGASGAEMNDVARLIGPSLDENNKFSLARCGIEGLEASNPLFAFQIMNNFTLCHGSILEGLAGPNAAIFSRGLGTVTALEEACLTLAAGDCERVLVGGADTATHPVTLAELEREGYLREGLVPVDAAAAIALSREAELPLGRIESIWVCPVERPRDGFVPRAGVLRDAAVMASADALAEHPCDLLVLAPWGAPAREVLSELPEALAIKQSIDLTNILGESLAATPAVAWVAALGMLVETGAKRALVLTAGPDGDLGAVVLTRGGKR
jgi:Beta-ketoacyl synthase, N-terminal domain